MMGPKTPRGPGRPPLPSYSRKRRMVLFLTPEEHTEIHAAARRFKKPLGRYLIALHKAAQPSLHGMARRCAWCGMSLAEGTEPATHGTCLACLIKSNVFTAAEVAKAKEVLT